jgi:RNA polymerase sigma-70 factor (ECF subfamily)
MTPQERDLGYLLRLQAQDESALGALYDSYGALLYSVALRITGSASDAEDVVQEAWVQAWKSSSSYDPRRGTVAAWLLTLARSRALDRWRSLASRKRAHEAVEVEAQPPADPNDPHSLSEQSQLRARLGAALAALAPEQRQVLELAYFRGLSQSEIAARIERPLGTVKSWTRQGLLRLREMVPQEDWV